MKVILTGVVLGLLAAIFIGNVKAKDLGQWNMVDPDVKNWYESLKQPDNGISCCGEADSWFCSEHGEGAQVYCVIDDDRDDAELKRRHIDNGTRIDIPKEKLNRDPNPTGHAVVFLSSGGYVWCFVGIGGV